MSKARPPTKREIAQVTQHYSRHMRRLYTETDQEQETMTEFMEDLFIAVFDDYVTRGYRGRLMVTISIEAIVELLIWDAQGNLYSLMCSG